MRDYRDDLLKEISQKKIQLVPDFWDLMIAPPLMNLLPMDRVYDLESIATSAKYSKSNKRDYMKQILEPFGFRRFAGGTNRDVYKHLEVPTILLKVAMDRAGMSNNPDEFRNQSILKPFCTKIFEVSPNGGVGVVERCTPIRNIEEFKPLSRQVFDLTERLFKRKFLVDDIGEMFFLNYAIREGFGVVLCDYPYVYLRTKRRMKCKKINIDGTVCNGIIDYDKGSNQIICSKCGKPYAAKEIGKRPRFVQEGLNFKGVDEEMDVMIKRGNQTVYSNVKSVETIRPMEHAMNETRADEPVVTFVRTSKDGQKEHLKVEGNSVVKVQPKESYTSITVNLAGEEPVVEDNRPKKELSGRVFTVDLSSNDPVVRVIDPKTQSGRKEGEVSVTVTGNNKNTITDEERSTIERSEDTTQKNDEKVNYFDDGKEYEKPVMQQVQPPKEVIEEEIDPYFNSPEFTIGAKVGIFDIINMAQFDKALEMKKLYQSTNGGHAIIRLVTDHDNENVTTTELDDNGSPKNNKELQELVDNVRESLDKITINGEPIDNYTPKEESSEEEKQEFNKYYYYEEDKYQPVFKPSKRKRRKFSDEELNNF